MIAAILLQAFCGLLGCALGCALGGVLFFPREVLDLVREYPGVAFYAAYYFMVAAFLWRAFP